MPSPDPKGNALASAKGPQRDVVRMLKETLLADRLQLPRADVQALLQAIQSDLGENLDLPPRSIQFDLEFLGRNVDLVYTIHRQNLPKE